jgi:pimeloyl-ACP methyl ester carboxylesterase
MIAQSILTHFNLAVLFLISAPALSSAVPTVPPTMNTGMSSSHKTGYAPANGAKLYYEIYGEEQPATVPLVLLHGGGDTIQTSFGRILPFLAQGRQVIAIEQRGFGHSADLPDLPFDFASSADDMAAVLAHLRVPRADFFGFSNGGTIAYQLAIRHPQIVRKLIAASAFFSHAGGYPWFWDSFTKVKLNDMPQELRDTYVAVSPHPEKLQSFFDKCVERMRNFKDIPESAMRGITAPTLIICGDADVMRPEHAVETFRLLPHAQMAILPGTDHMKVTSRTETLTPMINEFLAAPMPKPNDQKP